MLRTAIKLKRNGFTLIEVVLVIALLALVGLGAVVFSPSGAPLLFRLDAASKQVQSHIQYAQQNATLTRTTSGAVFVNAGTYTVYQGSSATPLLDPLTKQNLVLTLADKYPGITLSSNYTVEFDGFGAPTTGGGGTVTLTDGTNTKTITVTAGTGMVTVQ
jgi:prepilin-type N-terminal cleavage/methylation domain-containing protein